MWNYLPALRTKHKQIKQGLSALVPRSSSIHNFVGDLPVFNIYDLVLQWQQLKIPGSQRFDALVRLGPSWFLIFFVGYALLHAQFLLGLSLEPVLPSGSSEGVAWVDELSFFNTSWLNAKKFCCYAIMPQKQGFAKRAAQLKSCHIRKCNKMKVKGEPFAKCQGQMELKLNSSELKQCKGRKPQWAFRAVFVPSKCNKSTKRTYIL